MRTIGFVNWKGGVGKTSLSIHAAVSLAERYNAKVLFIDIDKQGNASNWFGADMEKGTLSNLLANGIEEDIPGIERLPVREVIQHTRYPNIDLIAGDADLLVVNLSILKNATSRQDNILKKQLNDVLGDYQVCVIDTPPDSNIPVLNGLAIMDDIIAVTLPNRFSMLGVGQLEKELSNYRKVGIDAKIRGIIINQFTSSTSCYNISKEIRSGSNKVFPHIRGGKAAHNWLERVINERKSIFELAPRSGYATDFNRFMSELVS